MRSRLKQFEEYSNGKVHAAAKIFQEPAHFDVELSVVQRVFDARFTDLLDRRRFLCIFIDSAPGDVLTNSVIFYQYVHHGTVHGLVQHLEDMGDTLPTAAVKGIMLQIAEALTFLHVRVPHYSDLSLPHACARLPTS